MRPFLTLTKALSDESRVRALLALCGRERCVCEIIELLDLAPSTVSKHMSILAQAGLIECRKEGRWHYFRLAGAEAPSHVRETLEWVQTVLKDSKIVEQDRKRLRKIGVGGSPSSGGEETCCRKK
ncbi:MAG TPA: metalloregulator ArsR/SmtB family transcription factor [Candidatus Sumerlaeota bacterium]|nr:metalloregulator ArsR/SmtB family transcription factor [Candidatus Sumerlaeota bacterium]